MQIVASYPVIVHEALEACRDFYCRWFGFHVVFEASWFVLLQAGEGAPVQLAFITPEHPSAPPSPAPFRGAGVFLTLQVADAARAYAELAQAGLRFAHPLTDEPWGQRRFGVLDPAGTWVDVVEQTEPAPDFWAPYLPASHAR